MKKLLAMLLALVLALSCTLSLAEADDAAALPALTVTGKYTVDREVLAAALTAFGADENAAALADAVAAVLTELGERLIVADNGVEIGLSLKDTDLITLVGELTDDGISLGSSLLPSHVLTVSGQTLGGILQSAVEETGNALADLDFNALGEAVSGHAETFINSCVNAVSYGEPESGDYVLDGISYNVMVPMNVDLEAIINALNTFIADMTADENIQAAIKTLEEKGFSITSGDNEPLSTENLPKLDFEAYMTVDEAGNTTGATDVVFKVYPPESEEVATMGDVFVDGEHVRVIAQFFDLENADATPVNVLYETSAIDEGYQHRMEFYIGELYFGFVCTVTNADVITVDSDIYVLDSEKPLLCEKVVIAQGGERTVALNDGSKEVVAVEDLVEGENAENLRNSLFMEALFSGIGIISSATEAMPEEVGTLMNLLTPAEDEPAEEPAAEPAA
ncbi:MAG: hypothetical protein IJH86_02265 [Clostridia bacterium]|nr:hypothetical protein [Clostridia bacterium]